MSTILLSLIVKFKGIIAGVASGFIAAVLLFLSIRKKTPDYSAANEINKQSNQVSKDAETKTEDAINENTIKTSASVTELHNADSLRKQREIAAKAVSDAND